MIDRAQLIDQQLIDFLNNFTEAVHTIPLGIDIGLLKEIFNSQLISRHLDLYARLLKDRGLGYYSIGSSGHEGMAAVAAALRPTDPAFLHYRDCAFYVQRTKQVSGIDPIEDILLSLVASKDDPISGGRHKVLGSKLLCIPPQTSTIASHLPKALGAALAIEKKQALSDIDLVVPDDAVVLCSFGDASFNHAVAQVTLNACEWWLYQNQRFPIIFVCEDNEIGISVPTPKHWIEDSLHGTPGIHYLQVDGLDCQAVYEAASQAAEIVRYQREPVFLHLKCVRLMGHAGSDTESQYRSIEAIERIEKQDPLLKTAKLLLASNTSDPKKLLLEYEQIRAAVQAKGELALAAPKLMNKKEVMASLVPDRIHAPKGKQLSTAIRQTVFGKAYDQLKLPRNMSQLINFSLTDLMLQYPEIIILGEDVAKKGGVYRVTADLQVRFGKARVMDTLLDETMILGLSIGLSQMGFLPIPEIQFLAYFHNAEDQIRGEAATLSFFSNGQFTNPMVIRIPGLGYQKGFGGHFHNDNSFAVLRDIPGIIIACPSHGLDAALMLKECVRLAYEEGRVVIFLEPIALYMTKDLENQDGAWLAQYPGADQSIAYGQVGIEGDSKEYLIITYGNGYYLSKQALKSLDRKGISAKLIDLRWLTPLPEKAILDAVKGVKHVLIVDECRRTGSLSEEIITLIVESLDALPIMKRLTAEDCFIPIGESWQYMLPSSEMIQKLIENWATEKIASQ